MDSIHKAAVLKWHQFDNTEQPTDSTSEWTIVGAEASISVTQHDGVEQEVRTVKNDGEANLFFPLDYSGPVTVTIKGSHSGEDTATLSIS